MTDVHVVHVFTDERGNFGDIATVVFDEGRKISDSRREEIARSVDAVETAFVNNVADRQVSFVHSQGEIDFAGVPALGVAWLLQQRAGSAISCISGRGGEIAVSHENGLTWVRASLKSMPPWNHVQLADVDAVEGVDVADTVDWEHTMVWAWDDKDKGVVRARTFATDWDIPEAQGNGSGSMLLAALVGRAIEVRHGDGSVIYARPAGADLADIGGRISAGESVVV